jgi:aspartate racemase
MSWKRIGIVGGIGPSATVLYYRGLIDGYYSRKKDQHFPEIVIHSLDFEEVNGYFEKDLGCLSDKVTGAVKGLQSAGCDFVLFACNAMHMVYDDVKRRTDVPMLSIIECVLQEVHRRGMKKVGLMATTFLMDGGVYQRLLDEAGIGYEMPAKKEQAWIMEAICQDLQRPPVPPATVARLIHNVDDMRRRGAEGLILACTDLPMAVTEENSPLYLFDSTKIHVNAALDLALGVCP